MGGGGGGHLSCVRYPPLLLWENSRAATLKDAVSADICWWETEVHPVSYLICGMVDVRVKTDYCTNYWLNIVFWVSVVMFPQDIHLHFLVLFHVKRIVLSFSVSCVQTPERQKTEEGMWLINVQWRLGGVILNCIASPKKRNLLSILICLLTSLLRVLWE